jgi:hypothetical protein
MSVDAITRELINDCLGRIAAGDPSAAFDLASTVMSHVDAKDVGLNLAIVESLVMLSKLQGCAEAADFLEGQWPDMKTILGKRWQRAGFT